MVTDSQEAIEFLSGKPSLEEMAMELRILKQDVRFKQQAIKTIQMEINNRLGDDRDRDSKQLTYDVDYASDDPELTIMEASHDR